MLLSTDEINPVIWFQMEETTDQMALSALLTVETMLFQMEEIVLKMLLSTDEINPVIWFQMEEMTLQAVFIAVDMALTIWFQVFVTNWMMGVRNAVTPCTIWFHISFSV